MKRVWITCGTGGVGKTTISAALAIREASRGVRVVVITIDPAKRLATSLGVHSLGNTPTDLTARVREAATQGPLSDQLGFHPEGQLWAMMPDTQQAFESFVRELAPDNQTAERVLGNSIFQIFAREFSGTNEYIALERLASLLRDPRFDLIVLDTPPARNTVDFLEAPELLARFFEEKLIRWLVLPANQIVAAGMKGALGLLEKLTGSGFMRSLMEFAQALLSVQSRFVKNLSRISEILRSPQVGFILVSSPAPALAQDATRFAAMLKKRGMHLRGLIVNRSFQNFEIPDDTAKEYLILDALKERESLALKEIQNQSVPVLTTIPELSRDIHCVEDLCHVARHLHELDNRLG